LARLQRGLLTSPEHRREHWQLAGQRIAPGSTWLDALQGEPQPAAVLIGVAQENGESKLLLTERSQELRHHAGQISFPGGRIEADDGEPLATAKREAWEEVGLAPEFVEPLGYLPDHIVLTGFRITPVVALLRTGFSLRIDAREVQSAFMLPLSVVVESSCYQPAVRMLSGQRVECYDLLHDGRVIWGATAGMLLALRELLSNSAARS
jgi:8-oxo-dGTP pyrophosphatase MutT (NUDIX family)